MGHGAHPHTVHVVPRARGEHVQAPAAISKQYSPACRYGVPHKDTYNDEDDVFPSRYLIVPAALLGLAVNQVTLLLTLTLTQP